MLQILYNLSHAVKLAHPHPSQSIRGLYIFDACGTSLPGACVAGGDAAAMHSLERPSLSSSARLLCLLITRHWQLDALHAAALRLWSNWLHIGTFTPPRGIAE